MGKLEGRAAIVTGAASGIGRVTAMLLAEEGAAVVVADRDEEHGQDTVREILRRGGTAFFMRTNVCKADDVGAMVRTAVDRYGRLDVLFNNAGINGEPAPTAECTLENWERVIGVNLKGVFLGMKYAIPEMLKNGRGSIINNASVMGMVGLANVPAYCTSKGGMIQLTKAMALEYAQQGIRVNAICPGLIWTEGMKRFVAPDEEIRERLQESEPMGRFGTPEEIARMVLFLASDDSSFCTGGTYLVDGGFVAV